MHDANNFPATWHDLSGFLASVHPKLEPSNELWQHSRHRDLRYAVLMCPPKVQLGHPPQQQYSIVDLSIPEPAISGAMEFRRHHQQASVLVHMRKFL
jgi:hypothetical protein